MAEAIKIKGLREFGRNLKRLDSDLPKALRVSNNTIADTVLGRARPRVPTLSGRARKSMKAKSTRTLVRISAGGRRAPHYGWLDFGGRVGRRKSVRRAFIADGRYLYPAYFWARDSGEIVATASRVWRQLIESAGIEVD